MMKDSNKSLRCGIVLAAGDGERLRPFIRRLRGDNLPKQYVNFVGTRSMLEHTFRRAEMLIPSERLFTVVSRSHLGHPEVRRQLSSRPGGNVVVQPENKETGPGLLLPLMHLYKRYPNSTVAVFPSDHFIAEESLFMAHVDLAFRVVERYPSYLVLLGMEAKEPEPEYGYIVPGNKVNHLAPLAIREVLGFTEKPTPPVARELIRQGGLWNTLVMVFNVNTLLDFIRRVTPAIYRSFERIYKAIGRPGESEVTQRVYRQMEPVNFSRGLLEPFSLSQRSSLLVVPVKGVFWSDLGSEQRIMSVLKKFGSLEGAHGRPENRLAGRLHTESRYAEQIRDWGVGLMTMKRASPQRDRLL